MVGVQDEAAHCVEQILQDVDAVDANDEGADLQGGQQALLRRQFLQCLGLAPDRLQVLHLLGKKPPQCAYLAAWLV